MQVGDLVKWTGYIHGDDGCTVGLVEAVCGVYIYVRWADGCLDEYEIDDWEAKRLDLEVVNESR